jgi:hypothetical protein
MMMESSEYSLGLRLFVAACVLIFHASILAHVAFVAFVFLGMRMSQLRDCNSITLYCDVCMKGSSKTKSSK